jgi:sugar phosphate isomerase/epimerase
MKPWKFCISTADEAPKTAPIMLCGDVCDNLKQAAALGFDAIEVHTRETAHLDYDRIHRTVQECGAKIGMIVSGRLNTEGLVDLMDDRPYVTDAAVRGMLRYVDMAKEVQAGVILGWVRGNIPKGATRRKYLDRFAFHLETIADYAKRQNVTINVEVINRYEMNNWNTAAEALEFLDHYGLENVYVHLDTYHMNIEEASTYDAICACGSRLGYLHVADNTRYYPGSGQIDFARVFAALDKIGYDGYLSMECLHRENPTAEAAKGLAYLTSIGNTEGGCC